MSHFRNHPWQLLWRPSFGSRSSSTPNIAGTLLAPALPMQVGAGKAVDGGTTRSSWDKPRIWPEKASNCHVGLCFKGASLSFSSVFPHWVPAPKGCQRGRQVLGAGLSTAWEAPAVQQQQLALCRSTAQLLQPPWQGGITAQHQHPTSYKGWALELSSKQTLGSQGACTKTDTAKQLFLKWEKFNLSTFFLM